MVRLAIHSRSQDADRKLEELHCSQDSLTNHLKQNFKIFKKDLKRTRKISMVILYAWLFMNTDPSYSARTIGSMMAQRMLSRSLLRPLAGDPGLRSGNGGLSTVEAIALIQAINSNNRGSQHSLDINSLKSELGRQERQSLLSTGISDRQLPVPVPVPRPIPATVIIAFVSAFFAAVAAGSSPINAFFAAFIALIVALAINKPEKKNDKALIKKLVIKKSVLPFVIPIPFPIPFPIPYKKGNNEVIYKYIPKPEHHHHYEKKKKKKHKYKKSDEIEEKQSHDELDKIESLIAEQDRIQRVVDSFVKHKDAKSAAISDRMESVSRFE